MESQVPKRQPLKTWNPKWKDKLKEMCLQRVRDGRTQMLWRIRNSPLPVSGESAHDNKYMESTFRNIVTDELKRVRQTSTNSAKDDTRRASEKEDSDMLWEYEAPAELANEDYVELMLAMERALYDDMQAELRAQEEALLEEFEAAASQEDDAIADLIQNFQDLSAVPSSLAAY